jgi:hypothetical protein
MSGYKRDNPEYFLACTTLENNGDFDLGEFENDDEALEAAEKQLVDLGVIDRALAYSELEIDDCDPSYIAMDLWDFYDQNRHIGVLRRKGWSCELDVTKTSVDTAFCEREEDSDMVWPDPKPGWTCIATVSCHDYGKAGDTHEYDEDLDDVVSLLKSNNINYGEFEEKHPNGGYGVRMIFVKNEDIVSALHFTGITLLED